ncbi:MAG: DUF192 domain-containing protein [Candidatus Omnitrophica bacterium]|nr:DUF192 domain-containing protein [Candidatus Omnitrophota bacterium]
MRVLNTSRGSQLCRVCVRARSFLTRARGLMGSRTLPEGKGLLLEPCNSVHTCFMRYPIDVVFIKERTIIGIVQNLAPWRLSPVFWGATCALELPAGTVALTSTKLGDEIELTS